MTHLQRLDLGSVQIHKKALAEIVAAAVSEVPGAKLISKNLKQRVSGLFGFEDIPGVDIALDQQNHISLEVKVIVTYGLSVPDIAKQIQTAIKAAMDRSVDIIVKEINVNIHGIERGSQ